MWNNNEVLFVFIKLEKSSLFKLGKVVIKLMYFSFGGGSVN